ncbi:MAG: hypothetical protein AMXMBFR64_41450 [Myxococcales bacterium]
MRAASVVCLALVLAACGDDAGTVGAGGGGDLPDIGGIGADGSGGDASGPGGPGGGGGSKDAGSGGGGGGGPDATITDATADGSDGTSGGCGADDDFGCPCESPTDCLSGYCIPSKDGPVCTVQCVGDCPAGWGCKQDLGSAPDVVFLCVPLDLLQCAPCDVNADCADDKLGLIGSCIPGGADGSFCGVRCTAAEPCAAGTTCATVTDVSGKQVDRCVPESGDCTCSLHAELIGASTTCTRTSDLGTCSATRRCVDGALQPCTALEPAEETCNAVDDDCDGATDEGLTGLPCESKTEWGACPGTGTCANGAVTCGAPLPQEEACDGKDNDCDGETDEGFKDTDGDGLADCVDTDDDDDGVPDDEDVCPTVPDPDQVDTDLDGKGDACDPDDDNDQVADADDCAPLDSKIHPGAKDDTCDGIDNDCDGETDEDVPLVGAGKDPCNDDDDGDGDPDATDCAPLDPSIYKGAAETCDGVDSNCNGTDNDEGAAGCTTYYQDKDGDGFGAPGTGKCLCAPEGAWTALEDTDCADTKNNAYPGGDEVCDGTDNDCDGEIDEAGSKGCTNWILDGDGDGWGKTGAAMCLCAPAAPYSAAQGGDCNDEDAAISPDGVEVCNGVDDNCNGQIDEGEGKVGCQTFMVDSDGDGFGLAGQTKCLCGPAAPYTATVGGDCNDADGASWPGANETCDGKDNDCDGEVDEEGSGGCTVWLKDADGDGWGVAGDSRCLCAKSAPWTASLGGDCNDGDGGMNPAQAEACNGKDDDCDGAVDEEGAAGCSTYWTDADGDGFGTSPSKCLCGPSGNLSVLQAGDCYDANALAKPGQGGWFTTHRGDGSFDYDCNNTQEPHWTEIGNCPSILCVTESKAGWVETGSAVPSCGSTASWSTSCYVDWPWVCPNSCCPSKQSRTQECR